jgi:hypothetical protein
MNSLDRFEIAIKLEEQDRIPILYQQFGAGYHVEIDAGITVKDAYHDPEKWQACN